VHRDGVGVILRVVHVVRHDTRGFAVDLRPVLGVHFGEHRMECQVVDPNANLVNEVAEAVVDPRVQNPRAPQLVSCELVLMGAAAAPKGLPSLEEGCRWLPAEGDALAERCAGVLQTCCAAVNPVAVGLHAVVLELVRRFEVLDHGRLVRRCGGGSHQIGARLG
jgi:hypothetical protein